MIHPALRLSMVLAGYAVACAVAAWVGLPPRIDLAGLVLLVPALLDLAVLAGTRRAIVSRPGLLIGALRRPLDVVVTVSGARASRVALGWPATLGGPLSPVRTRRRVPRSVLRWRTVPVRRGAFAAGPVWVLRSSPLGMWTRREVHEPPCEVHVLPDLHGPADDPLARELERFAEQPRPGALASAGDIEGLRTFASGDDPRLVDWKATARRGTPIVRDWRPDRRRSILVALDAGRLMRAEHDGESKLDGAVRAIARLALAAERWGDAIGVVVYADRVVARLPPVHAHGQAARLVRGLAGVAPHGVGSDLARALPVLASMRPSLLVTITDVLDPAGGQALVGPLRELTRVHAPVLVLLRDPSLDLRLDRPIAELDDVFQRAAAELVLRERAAAVSLARTAGVPVLDVSLRTLAREVVSAYATERARASPG